MLIGVEIEHRKAIAIYRAAGYTYPKIPEGCNTYWEHFTTAEGMSAIVINQRGFARRPEDGGEEVCGCSVAVALDAADAGAARAALDAWVRAMLPEASA
jgi:hypothetical protein